MPSSKCVCFFLFFSIQLLKKHTFNLAHNKIICWPSRAELLPDTGYIRVFGYTCTIRSGARRPAPVFNNYLTQSMNNFVSRISHPTPSVKASTNIQSSRTEVGTGVSGNGMTFGRSGSGTGMENSIPKGWEQEGNGKKPIPKIREREQKKKHSHLGMGWE